MVPGTAITVTIVVAVQRPPIVYVMLAVPAVAPDTSPPVPTVTVVEPADVLQVPPAVPSVNVVLLPAQKVFVPLMTPGTAYTVTMVAAVQVPMV